MTHPYTGRPDLDYFTVVFERVGDHTDGAPSELFASLQDSTVCSLTPGFRVTAFSIGDVLSEQEHEEQ